MSRSAVWVLCGMRRKNLEQEYQGYGNLKRHKHRMNSPFPSRIRLRSDKVFVGAVVVLLLLVAIVAVRVPKGHTHAYVAESLLAVRLGTNVIVPQVFEGTMRAKYPEMLRVDFLFSHPSRTTLKGTTVETNCVMRILAAGATGPVAEQQVGRASDSVRSLLEEMPGVEVTTIGRAQSTSARSVHEPFKFRIGYRHPEPFPVMGRVMFPGPGVSIDPIEGWTRSYTLEPDGNPMLIGQGRFNGAFISVYRLDPKITNIADGLAANHPSVGKAVGLIESSYKEEPFEALGGLTGVRSMYVQKYWAGRPMTQTVYDYVFTNANSQFVSLRYHTVSGGEADNVQRMIRESLHIEADP